MTRREVLIEQYEDALFALLMDEVAETTGKAALEENRRLRESGELEIPAALRERSLRTIHRKIAEKNAGQFGKSFSKVVSRVAVAALVAMLMFTTAFALSKDFRIRTLNFIVESFGDYTEFKFAPDEASVNRTSYSPQISVNWMPPELTLVNDGADTGSVWKEYRDDQADARITISAIDVVNGGFNLDTEGTEMLATKIRGVGAFLIKKDDTVQILWEHTERSGWISLVTGENVPVDTLIKVAENTIIG